MAANETKAPTPTEIMEEIKKSRDEVLKEIEGSKISMWLTPAAFGATVMLFGASQWADLSTFIPIAVIGLVFMIWARCMAKKAQRRFRAKWNEPPRKF